MTKGRGHGKEGDKMILCSEKNIQISLVEVQQ